MKVPESTNVGGYQETGNMLFGYLTKEAEKYFQKEEKEKSKIKSLKDWKKRKEYLLLLVQKMVGSFPEKPPLNPVITGKLKRDGYIIEKIIFETRPLFYVTGNLYLPEKINSSLPAILVPCGHSQNGKAYSSYQKISIGLVKQGYIVLIYDPLGQGERLQYFNPNKPNYGFWGTREHSYEGNQCYLTGANLAQYMIWDSIRAIDYLYSRPEVDKEKIGCIGQSGGGTNTAYLCAMEERIKVAIPCCYITERGIYLKTGNPHDAEQNFSGAIRYGLNYDDFLSLFAPKPLLIGACKWDFFPIEGTRIAYKRANQIYSLYNASRNISLIETIFMHSLNKKLRESAYEWFNLHFKGEKKKVSEPELLIEEDKDLQCTKTGQINSDFPKVNTVFSFNRDFSKKIIPKFSEIKSKEDILSYKKKIKEKLEKVFLFKERRKRTFDPRCIDQKKENGYTFEKWFFYSEEEIIVPLLVIKPENSKKDSVYLFIGREKEKIIQEKNKEVKKLLNENNIIVSLDYRGIGEAKSRLINPAPYESAWGTVEVISEDFIMLESPLITLQTFDVVRAISFLKEELKIKEVNLYGKDKGALLALFSACFSNVSSLYLENMLLSFQDLVESKKYKASTDIIIPGILTQFDLPDIIAYFSPLKIYLKNIRGGDGEKVSKEKAKKRYILPLKVYEILRKKENIFIE